ncbi:hypothetical protein B0T22DRAFT_198452 [Podospora appendiculata]|uniref:Transmembrane protein n=1 Tax=Podospora appendiculata TaxID=314037 RepID=A0AAE0X438_9PEZI|nr:hypothetical protein B0T22DRAFT_198452 [Podospora appendiculata]
MYKKKCRLEPSPKREGPSQSPCARGLFAPSSVSSRLPLSHATIAQFRLWLASARPSQLLLLGSSLPRFAFPISFRHLFAATPPMIKPADAEQVLALFLFFFFSFIPFFLSVLVSSPFPFFSFTSFPSSRFLVPYLPICRSPSFPSPTSAHARKDLDFPDFLSRTHFPFMPDALCRCSQAGFCDRIRDRQPRSVLCCFMHDMTAHGSFSNLPPGPPGNPQYRGGRCRNCKPSMQAPDPWGRKYGEKSPDESAAEWSERQGIRISGPEQPTP